MQVNLNEQQARFLKRACIAAALVFAVTWVLVQSLSDTWRLAVDFEKLRCLPWHVYQLDLRKNGLNTQFERGEMVRFIMPHLPPFPDNAPLVKMVAGVPGDEILVQSDRIFINGSFWGELPLWKTLNGHKGQWDREFVVPDGKYLMLGTEAESYDGRYWGVIDASQIVGKASLLF